MLVVCSNKDLHGFTYGRLYVFTYDPDLFDTGYTWVKNDKGIIVGEPASNFRSLTDWKKTNKIKIFISTAATIAKSPNNFSRFNFTCFLHCIQNRNAILWALTSGVL